MKIVSGRFNGTGAALYVCCGFVPDKVIVRNVEDTTCMVSTWNRESTSAEQCEGVLETQGVSSAQAATAGIAPYYGGDVMTSTNQTSVSYGNGVYIAKDEICDYRGIDITTGSDAIDSWTLGSSGNRTGNFNNDVTGTYIGEGSRINIDGKWYSITALTAGQGISANEVTLSGAPATGNVYAIQGMYTYKPVALGKVTPAGFKISNVTTIADDKLCLFEAYLFDA